MTAKKQSTVESAGSHSGTRLKLPIISYREIEEDAYGPNSDDEITLKAYVPPVIISHKRFALVCVGSFVAGILITILGVAAVVL